MSTRVDGDEVKEIIETELTALQIVPFITAANLIVTDQLTGEHSAALLVEIERWLAAHFVAIRDPRAKAEKTDDASATYYGKDGLGLNHTPYGQQVKILDTTGILASLGKRKAEFRSIDLDL